MKRLLCITVVIASATGAVAQTRTDAHGDALPDGAVARFGTVRYRIGASGPFALSADGKTLAVGSGTGVTLWDVETGKPVVRIPFAGHCPSGSVPGPIAFSPDGKNLVMVLHRILRIWDTGTGRQRIAIELPFDARKVYFFPGTNHFAVTEDQTTNLSVFDVVTGRQIKAAKPEAEVDVLSPSGRYFLGTAKSDDLIVRLGASTSQEAGLRHIVDARTGKLRWTDTTGHPDWPMEMSPDDRFVYSVTTYGNLRSFDAETGKRLESSLDPPPGWKGLVEGGGLALSPAGDVVYLWRAGGFPTHRRDLKAGKWLDPLPAMPLGRLIPHPDGRHILFLGEQDGLLRRYDLTTLKELPPPAGFDTEVVAAAKPDGRWVVVQSGPRTPGLDMFDPTGRLVWSLQSEPGAQTSWGPDGRLVVAGQRGIEYRDPATGKQDRKLTPPAAKLAPVPTVMFNADQKRLVVGYYYSSLLRVFDTATGKQIGGGDSVEHGGGVPSLSPDGATVALGSHAQGVCLVDTATGKVRVPWTDPPPHCTPKSVDALFSPDGTYILDWDDRGVAVLRDPVTARRNRSFNTGYDHVRVFAISPDGLWLAIGTQDGMVTLWDVATGRQVWAKSGHAAEVTRVGFAGPGRLVSSSRDLTALLWDFTSDKKPSKPLWDALSGSDGLEAFQAMCALGADPHGPNLLRRKVEPAKPARTEDVKKWIAELGADKFAVREAATMALRNLGRLVEDDQRAARDKTTSVEVRTRLEGLLADIPRERTASELIQARAVAAMELAGSDAARKLLSEWAAGAPGARLTVDAKAALGRLVAASDPHR